MSTHKNIDKICCVALAVILLLTILFMNGELIGIKASSASPAYETKLFDTSKVHSIDIIIDDWEGFLENCTNEEYVACSVNIDGELFKNVAFRAKGNTSLSSVRSYGNNRYSFKIEFDGYDNGKNYYGLDKLCLNNIIQDNTYAKDYLVYRMMNEFDAAAPLVSYVSLSVNGEYFGLYLAVEAVEDSFLTRNFGKDSGNLYKPDSMNMGGGRGNGKNFDFNEFDKERAPQNTEPTEFKKSNVHDNHNSQERGQKAPEQRGMPAGFGGGMPGRGFGSSDVSLIYTDDEYSSYRNIFENAKTDITDKDRDTLINSLKNLTNNTDIESTVDIDAVIRYFVVHNFSVNFDSYTGSMIHNYYLYEKNGTLSMLPWDYNLAFGGFQASSDATSIINYPIDTPVSGGTVESRPMLSWIFANESYTELYHKYFDEFISSYFESGKFETELDSVKALISPYVKDDPTKFCTYDEFEKGIETLRKFCLLRAEGIRAQLDGEIPATSEGQKSASSSLISGEGISIPDMGSMGNMGRGKAPDSGTDAPAQGNNFPGMPEGGPPNGGEGMQRPQDFGNMQPPGMNFGENSDFSQARDFALFDSDASLLILSFLILLVGIFVAMIYKH